MSKWSPQDWIAFFGAVATFLTACTGALVSVLTAIRNLDRKVNGRMDQLLEERGLRAHVEGREEGRLKEADRVAANGQTPTKGD